MAATAVLANDNGSFTSAIMPALTSMLKISGDAGGAEVLIEIWDATSADKAPLWANLGNGAKRGQWEPGAYSVSIPAGWTFVVTLSNKVSTPNLRVAAE